MLSSLTIKTKFDNDSQTDVQTFRYWTNRETDTHTHRNPDRQIDTDIQVVDRETKRQICTDNQINY